MRFKNPLDKILSSKAKIKALRYLVNYGKGISAREFSREIGIAPPNILKTLRELENENIAVSERFGRSIVYTLNKNHFLVDKIIFPLFKNEAGAKNELGKKIMKYIKFPFESIILFGSIARGEEEPKSDIDIAFIIKDAADENQIEREALDINPILSEYFGNSISPIVIKKSDFVKKLKKGDHLFSSIAKEGEVIGGKLINDLL
ncbi:MAG: nucleotidyltransferase domain-containing protein [bacterium]|nr:nucleotidyltransferase domain-containing protein [bacterium]